MVDCIYLDVDGVLVNWVKGAASLFGKTEADVYANWEPQNFDVAPPLGITEDELWEKIDAAGMDWWADLELMPWAKDLYQECLSLAPVYFLTSPSYHWSSAAGKLVWFQKFTGNKHFRNYLIGPPKERCSLEGSVLIDDADRNISAFTKKKGQGVLVPRYWNSLYAQRDDPMAYVIPRLRGLAGNMTLDCLLSNAGL